MTSCLIPRLLVVFTRQLEILVTTQDSLFQCYDLERQLPVCQFKSLNIFEDNSKGEQQGVGSGYSGFQVSRLIEWRQKSNPQKP